MCSYAHTRGRLHLVCGEEGHGKSLLLPIIYIDRSDLSIFIDIHIIGPKKSIVLSLGHAGEVGRAVAASVGRALGKNLIRNVLIDPDVGCPVAIFPLVEDARYAF